ncbi:protein unc-50 homolog [Oscarella lobularis]|uniref:protein unc-50 homolog n=1 Tax=Oscarella lobularis TaxID=121494 RepID=UPI0033137DB2
MLPNGETRRRESSSRRFQYIKRIFKWRHMDFEFALWQMFYLCANPRKVYRNFQYHKQTKDFWARDDPAFLVLLAAWLLGSSIFYAIVLPLNVARFFQFFLWTVFGECIGIGLIVAALLWLFTNRVLKVGNEKVEWAYAFDIHLNAYFPTLIILHMIQVFLLHKSSHNTTLVMYLGNFLWLLALSYYCYITFLGYSSLRFLRHTVIFIYPIALFLLLFALTPAHKLSCSSLARDFYTEITK